MFHSFSWLNWEFLAQRSIDSSCRPGMQAPHPSYSNKHIITPDLIINGLSFFRPTVNHNSLSCHFLSFDMFENQNFKWFVSWKYAASISDWEQESFKLKIPEGSRDMLAVLKAASNYTALPQQKEVMTIFMFLRYEIKTKFCLIYPIFNKKFKIFDA